LNHFVKRTVMPVLFCTALWPLSSQQGGRTAFPSLETDPQAQIFNARAREGGLSWRDLAEIALWASEVEAPPRTRRTAGGSRDYYGTITGAVEAMLASPDLPADPRGRGEYVLARLHRQYLKTYSLMQTRLDEIFASGRYNCVSSAVLYAIFAEAAGLEVRGVMTRDHAFVSLRCGNDWVDVETTNPWGFDPGRRHEFQNDFGRVTGFAYVPPGNYRDRTNITPLELASLILSNRMAELERAGRFAEAVPLALNRAALLSGCAGAAGSGIFTSGEGELRERLLNYGRWLINSGKEADALAWVEYAGGHGEGSAVEGADWEELRYTALHNLAARQINAGNTLQARETVDRYGARLSPAHRQETEALVSGAELAARVRRHGASTGSGAAGSGEDASRLLADIEAARAAFLLNRARAEELRTAVIINEGNHIAGSRGYAAAAAYIAGAISRYGRNTALENALNLHRQNRQAELHNAFARLYNARNFEAARNQAGAALEEFPGNSRFRDDLRAAEEALRRR
jgi:hypothetical protein